MNTCLYTEWHDSTSLWTNHLSRKKEKKLIDFFSQRPKGTPPFFAAMINEGLRSGGWENEILAVHNAGVLSPTLKKLLLIWEPRNIVWAAKKSSFDTESCIKTLKQNKGIGSVTQVKRGLCPQCKNHSFIIWVWTGLQRLKRKHCDKFVWVVENFYTTVAAEFSSHCLLGSDRLIFSPSWLKLHRKGSPT